MAKATKQTPTEVVVPEAVRDVRERSNIRLREVIVYLLMATYVAAVVASFTLIYLDASGAIDLSQPLTHYIGGSVVAEIAGLLIVPIRDLFPSANEET